VTDVDDPAARVAERYASKKFDSMYDLQLFMESLPGWKRVKSLMGSKYVAFTKKFGVVNIELGWEDSVWNRDAYIYAPMPRSVGFDGPEYEALKEKLYQRIHDIPGKSWPHIEKTLLDVAKAWKGSSKRQKKDRSSIRYKPGYGQDYLQGDEAYKRWLSDVRDFLQREIDKSAQHGTDWTTRDLADWVMQHSPFDGLIGVSRRDMGKAISRLLNAMAKAGKIEKDTNNPRVPRWLGLNWVPRKRPGW